MSSENSLVEKVISPLHKLQKDISKDLLPSILEKGVTSNSATTPEAYFPSPYTASGSTVLNDNDSVYSFESVSTSGRLLDRLDLDFDESNYSNDSDKRRDSYLLMHSIGRPSDRAGNDDDQNLLHAQSLTESRTKPIRANSSISLERMRTGTGMLSRTHSQSARMPLQSTSYKTILRKEAGSVISFRADISNQASSTSLASMDNGFSNLPHMPMQLKTALFRNTKTASDPDLKVDKEAGAAESSASPALYANGREIMSSSSNCSTTSIETSIGPVFNPNLKFDSSFDKLVKQALQAKAQGNFRESSYQLQTLANTPNNYPRAMYLYGKALKLGQGVKLNESHAVKWFSRCILVSYIVETVTIDSTSMNNYATKLSELDPQECVKMVQKNIESEDIDPINLFAKFSQLPQLVMNKLIQNNSKDNNAVGGAYYQLGECILQGLGTLNKDEITGRMFLTKAASCGSSEAMVKLGELWTAKSKHFKKDLHQAAAWLRLGEHFGIKIIGNSWIYKEKYTLKGKSRK